MNYFDVHNPYMVLYQQQLAKEAGPQLIFKQAALLHNLLGNVLLDLLKFISEPVLAVKNDPLQLEQVVPVQQTLNQQREAIAFEQQVLQKIAKISHGGVMSCEPKQTLPEPTDGIAQPGPIEEQVSEQSSNIFQRFRYKGKVQLQTKKKSR